MDHPSQRQHACLTMENDEQLCLYFDRALERISNTNVMDTFTQSLGDIKPHDFEMVKYRCADWRSDFCENQRRALKEETFKLR